MNNLIEAEAQALELQGQLAVIKIVDQASYDVAVDARVNGKQWLSSAHAWFDSIQKPAYDAYKAILEKRKQVCDPVERKIAEINRSLLGWDEQQERLRREEQRRLEAEARAKAEEERLLAAQHLEESGADAESVNCFLEAPVTVTAPAVAAPTYEKSGAVVYRDNYSAEVTDFFKLIQAVAKDRSKINLLQPNQTALNAMAKALKQTMSIPGVRAVNNRTVASGRGR